MFPFLKNNPQISKLFELFKNSIRTDEIFELQSNQNDIYALEKSFIKFLQKNPNIFKTILKTDGRKRKKQKITSLQQKNLKEAIESHDLPYDIIRYIILEFFESRIHFQLSKDEIFLFASGDNETAWFIDVSINLDSDDYEEIKELVEENNKIKEIDNKIKELLLKQPVDIESITLIKEFRKIKIFFDEIKELFRCYQYQNKFNCYKNYTIQNVAKQKKIPLLAENFLLVLPEYIKDSMDWLRFQDCIFEKCERTFKMNFFRSIKILELVGCLFKEVGGFEKFFEVFKYSVTLEKLKIKELVVFEPNIRLQQIYNLKSLEINEIIVGLGFGFGFGLAKVFIKPKPGIYFGDKDHEYLKKLKLEKVDVIIECKFPNLLYLSFGEEVSIFHSVDNKLQPFVEDDYKRTFPNIKSIELRCEYYYDHEYIRFLFKCPELEYCRLSHADFEYFKDVFTEEEEEESPQNQKIRAKNLKLVKCKEFSKISYKKLIKLTLNGCKGKKYEYKITIFGDKCKNLKELSLKNSSVIFDGDFTSLERLSLSLGLKGFNIERFPNIKELNLGRGSYEPGTTWTGYSYNFEFIVLKKLEKLKVEDVKFAGILNFTPNIQELTISRSSYSSNINIGNLSELQHLKMLSISFFGHLSIDTYEIKEVENLESIMLDNTSSITIISDLPNLKEMTLTDCKNLKSIIKCSSLIFMNITKCPDLKLISNLQKLEEIIVKDCPKLEKVEILPILEELSLIDCPILRFISNLPALKILRVNTSGITVISNLPALKNLRVKNCKDLTLISNLPALKELALVNCPKLETVEKCPNLKGIIVEGRLDFQMLKILPKDKKLIIKNSSNIEIEGILTEKEIVIENCPELILISNLPNVKFLTVKNCPKLEKIDNLPKSDEVIVKNCPRLKLISNLPNVEELTVKNCPELKEFKRIYNLVEFNQEFPKDYMSEDIGDTNLMNLLII